MNDTVVQVSPVKIRIPSSAAESLTKTLTYEDKKITYEWLKWRKIQQQDDAWLASSMKRPRHWFLRSHSRTELDLKIKELADARYQCILFKDEEGYYTYSGLAAYICKLKNLNFYRAYELPERENIHWDRQPEHEPRYYQSDSVKLLAPDDYSRCHGAVELFTGAGKSYTMALLLKKIGLPAVVVAPSISIAEQLLKDFRNWFGFTKVGQFFDGKKQFDKFFVVAVSDSLVQLKDPESKEYKAIAGKKVLVCDESHLVPAETLASMALGLLGGVPYRYFFSGTQLRNDGLGLLLDSIIGDVVLKKDVREGIEEGFIAPIKVIQWQITSDSKFDTDDPIKNTMAHLRYNQKLNDHAVKLAKAAVSKGRRVLILIQNVEQFPYLIRGGLLNGLRVSFAHGGNMNKKQKPLVPKEFHKPDNLQLVSDFDDGKYDVLVGTSAIQVGTDIRSVSCIIYLVGLTSPIQIRQGAIGRGTRLFPGKTDCIINDYCVTNIEKQLTHGKKRVIIFNSVYGKVIYKECK